VTRMEKLSLDASFRRYCQATHAIVQIHDLKYTCPKRFTLDQRSIAGDSILLGSGSLCSPRCSSTISCRIMMDSNGPASLYSCHS